MIPLVEIQTKDEEARAPYLCLVLLAFCAIRKDIAQDESKENVFFFLFCRPGLSTLAQDACLESARSHGVEADLYVILYSNYCN